MAVATLEVWAQRESHAAAFHWAYLLELWLGITFLKWAEWTYPDHAGNILYWPLSSISHCVNHAQEALRLMLSDQCEKCISALIWSLGCVLQIFAVPGVEAKWLTLVRVSIELWQVGILWLLPISFSGHQHCTWRCVYRCCPSGFRNANLWHPAQKFTAERIEEHVCITGWDCEGKWYTFWFPVCLGVSGKREQH